jgi:cytochrome P450
MTATSSPELVFDPTDPELVTDPHPVLRRLRDEAPLYYNDQQDFYALTRYEDVERALVDKTTFISGHGTTLGMIKMGIQLPPGTVLFEDPPAHTIHRKLLARLFTARQLAKIEGQTRQFCAEVLDPLVGSTGFDFVKDFARHIPTRVIAMLIGIPDSDAAAVRDKLASYTLDEEGSDELFSGGIFQEYVDWRIANPSDDIMTQLLNAEFEDEHGETRHLTPAELLAYVNIVAMAGNETTRHLLSWTAKLLADNPDQRRLLVEDPARIPNAVEEVLRLEGPVGQSARFVSRDVEVHGQTVPAGSHMALVLLAANHDDRVFDDPDRFDVERPVRQQLTFGFGPHFCLGAALARLEARIAIDEVLTRFPEWDVDDSGAEMKNAGMDIRGWHRLPITVS